MVWVWVSLKKILEPIRTNTPQSPPPPKTHLLLLPPLLPLLKVPRNLPVLLVLVGRIVAASPRRGLRSDHLALVLRQKVLASPGLEVALFLSEGRLPPVTSLFFDPGAGFSEYLRSLSFGLATNSLNYKNIEVSLPHLLLTLTNLQLRHLLARPVIAGAFLEEVPVLLGVEGGVVLLVVAGLDGVVVEGLLFEHAGFDALELFHFGVSAGLREWWGVGWGIRCVRIMCERKLRLLCVNAAHVITRRVTPSPNPTQPTPQPHSPS